MQPSHIFTATKAYPAYIINICDATAIVKDKNDKKNHYCIRFGLELCSSLHIASSEVLSEKGTNEYSCYHRGSQPLSDHVPLHHFDRSACAHKVSYDKKAE